MKDSELRQLGQPDTFDNTMLSTWTTCPRRFYWFMRGLDYKTLPAYFTFGRAWGVAMNWWHKTQGAEGPEGPLSTQQRIALALHYAEEEWNKDTPIEARNDTFDNLRNMLHQYVECYGSEEPWTMPYGEGELGFRLPIPSTSVYYAGALDAPIDWPPYGMLLREDKSTGAYIGDSYLDQWEYSSQVTGYIWAVHQTLGREPFGAYMNIASKAPRKDSLLRFARVLIKRSEWQLANFMQTTLLLIDDIRREYDRWLWPKLGERDPINCSGGMGRSACLYKRLCLMEMEPWELEESYNFDQEFLWRSKWEPWERRGENE